MDRLTGTSKWLKDFPTLQKLDRKKKKESECLLDPIWHEPQWSARHDRQWKRVFLIIFTFQNKLQKNFTFSWALFLAESHVKLNRINVHQLNRDGSSTQHFFLLFQYYFFNHPEKYGSPWPRERDFFKVLKLFFHIQVADMNRNRLMLCSRTLTRFSSKHRRQSIDHTIVFARHETSYPSSGNMTMRTDRRGWGKMICIKRLAEEKAGDRKNIENIVVAQALARDSTDQPHTEDWTDSKKYKK